MKIDKLKHGTHICAEIRSYPNDGERAINVSTQNGRTFSSQEAEAIATRFSDGQDLDGWIITSKAKLGAGARGAREGQ